MVNLGWWMEWNNKLKLHLTNTMDGWYNGTIAKTNILSDFYAVLPLSSHHSSLYTAHREPTQANEYNMHSVHRLSTYLAACNTVKRRVFTSPPRHAKAKKHAAYVRSALSSTGGSAIPYWKGWAWQHVLLERRLNYMRSVRSSDDSLPEIGHEVNAAENCDRDWLLLFEHEPVYTMGRGASEEHLKFLDTADPNQQGLFEEKLKRLSRKYRGEDASRLIVNRSKLLPQYKEQCSDREEITALIESGAVQNTPVYSPNGAPVYRIERGGEVTYHGPGQLVIYPMLNLRHSAFKQDLHWYLRQIEEVIIQTLREFDIESNRDEINTGVWVGMNKIAAVGVSSSRWITTHGCAINVRPNLDHFDKEIITPCGIEERGITSILDIVGEDSCPSVMEVANVAVKCFGNVFNVDVVEDDPISR
ncbi:hypothetical protein HJC23_008171 [Cyclotella cryptica]|uniref:lipoyl(octanoyl) transferase n=1 Tax=Cyclotella cryptica TaxID=29204 RepID=A0ABD3PLV5_9STRA